MPKSLQNQYHNDFNAVYQLILDAQSNTWHQVNQQLIMLYWRIGEYLAEKAKKEAWGKNVVNALADYLKEHHPSAKGFSARNLWRMKQFFETYQPHPKLSALLTEITWTNHLHILSKTKTLEEKQFYLSLAAKSYYTERNFARVIDSATYERTALADQKLPILLKEFPVSTKGIFKDSYVFEFVELPEDHREHDLRRALIGHLKHFLFELGPDFTLMGEEYSLQVGNKDFRIDLLLFNRELNGMVAIEIKCTEFKPAHLGQLQFYLEVLDHDIKKPHENPTIGILICKTKDDEVVKYALNRHASPTLIAEYETKLIKKSVLEKKLHELAQLLPWEETDDE